jgi:hypothetical protein
VNLDDELHRLFTDDRLDLPVRPGAERIITDGAQRRRDRRAALSRTGIAAALIALLAVPITQLRSSQGTPVSPTDPGSDPAQAAATSAPAPTTAPPTTTTTPRPPFTPDRSTATSRAPSSTSPPPPKKTTPIGPTGYRGLTLAMTTEQAEATGLIVPNAQPTSSRGCAGYDYKGTPNQPSYYSVVISPKYGVVRIGGRSDAITPEGITVGSPESEMKRVYPTKAGEHGAVGEWVTAVPTNPDAQYWIIAKNKAVSEIRIELAIQDCYD